MGQTVTMEQDHNNVHFHPSLPQQAQMPPLNILPNMQSPFQQQVHNSQFGGSSMTWSSYGNVSHCLQSSSAVRMTPSVTVTPTPSFPILQTSQPRAVDTPISRLHDQYDSSSQQRPVYGMCDHPTGQVPLLPPSLPSVPPPLQVSILYIFINGNYMD